MFAANKNATTIKLEGTTNLDRIYICKRCHASFLFQSDWAFHQQQEMGGHDECLELSLSSLSD
jgi:hypothetical protein